jgi:alkylation response protein AidB-like acyl-CoA dehydrogenase
VQVNLARVRAKTEYLTLINWKVASGSINPAVASSAKVFGTEFFTEGYRLLLEVIGHAGSDPAAEALRTRIERSMQGTLILTFGGGTNEVQRDLIALFGLKLPRIPRH